MEHKLDIWMEKMATGYANIGIIQQKNGLSLNTEENQNEKIYENSNINNSLYFD